MRETPRVAILVETSRKYGRGLLGGIARYVSDAGPWSMYFEPHGVDAPPPRWLADWQGDGILARINDRTMGDAVLATGLPFVDLRNILTDVHAPRLGPDNQMVARMGLEHLVDRGFRQVGFCSVRPGRYWFLDARCDHFRRLAAEAGLTCEVFHLHGTRRRPATWEQQQEQLAQWLRALPRPIGLMTCNDDVGHQVLDACLRVGVAVPDDVAVVSVDNDEYLCNLSTPSLTSIDLGLERIGYAAAAMLARMMERSDSAAYPTSSERAYTEFAPGEVIVRRSTDVLAIEDPDVAAALRMIREQACEPINVEQVVKRLAVSRSTLERRFAKLVGRTPKQEIVRVQLAEAKRRLANSKMSLAMIAQRCGFGAFSHFSQTFRRQVGVSPSEYRAQSRIASPEVPD